MTKWILGSRGFAVAATLCGALASPSPSNAAAVPFTDLTSFQAATNSATTFGFDGIVADNSTVFSSTGFTVGGVNFVDSVNSFVIGANAGFGTYGVPFFSGQNRNGTVNQVTVTLSTPRTAFAFDFGSYVNTDLPISIALSTGDTFGVALPPAPTLSTASFIGFTSTIPISSLTLTESANEPSGLVLDITDFTLATANSQSVPEPTSLVLIATALVGTGFIGRRKAA